jgi:hypothetical protein
MLINSNLLFSQVAINADGRAPDPSAGLDLNFADKGFLLPRMGFEQRDSIENPAEGLMIYCIDCSADGTGALCIFQNGLWRVFDLNCAAPVTPNSGNSVPSLTQITWNWNTVPIAIGYKWNSTNDYSTATDLGQETSFTETGLTCMSPYTRYVWAYNLCGQSPVRILTDSTSQIPISPIAGGAGVNPTDTSMVWTWAPVSGAAGYRINSVNDYSTAVDVPYYIYWEGGLSCLTSYTRYVWAYHDCGISTPVIISGTTLSQAPDPPVPGTHVPAVTQIIWHWNPVAGATGYLWNSVDDSLTATNMGTSTSETQSGLTCNTSYTSYVWTVDNCGVSAGTMLTQSTTLDPPAAPVAATHIPQPTQIIWNWNAVGGATGYKWGTSNNYANAIDMGTSTSKTETGLTCNSSYTRYIWAYSSCGVSSVTTLSQNTSLDPPAAPVAGTHNPSPTQVIWNWNTVTGASGYKWNSSNDYGTALDMGNTTTKTETGLSCNTPYTRYVWAYGNCGVSVSSSLTQTTSMNPPASPVAATHVPSPTQIVWNWNTVSGATGYKWSSTNDYGTATDMGTATTKTESGLICNTPYSSYIWAYSNCGVSSVTALTQTTSLDPPAAPVTSTHIPSPTQIIWNWNTVSGATGYKWNTLNDYGSATNLGNVSTYTETSLMCNTSYTRYIWAYSNCGISIVTSLTQTTSLDPPASPVAATHVPQITQITWNWNTVSGATGYKWNTTNTYSSAIDMGSSTSKVETGLTCNTPYTRYVWAYSSCGVSAVTNLTQSTLVNPPASPTAGTHVPSVTQIVWNWNTVPGAAGYKWNTVNNYGTATDMLTTRTKTETGLTCNTSYDRFVWAYNSCGVSTVTTLTMATLTNPPGNPTAGAHIPGITQIAWHWNTVSGAAGYKWSTANDYSNATDMGTATTTTETGLACNTSFIRFVWAYNNCGVSISTTLSASTLTDPPAAPIAATHNPLPTQIVWNWNTVSGATGYKWGITNVYASATDVGASISHTETGLTCNTSYTRYIWAYSNCGVSASTTLTQATSLDPPASPVAGTHTATSNEIVWNWNTVTGATGYKWNTTSDYGTATDMGTTLTHTETGLTCNISYTRYVWAYSNCGVSTPTTLSKSTTNDPPATPVAATNVSSPEQIIWNWNPVSGATGYLWNASNNPLTATNMGTATTKTETGLTCNTSYSRYIWSYNTCDTSISTTLTQLTSLDPPDAPTAGTHVPDLTQIVWHWNTVEDATGYKWNTSNNYNTAEDMVASTSKTETGLTCNSSYTRYIWAYGSCGPSESTTLTASTSTNPPVAPVEGTHTSTSSEIVWNWQAVSGATGYKWNTTDDYGSALDMGTNISYTETGLACNTNYTRYVWAYVDCGGSTTTPMTKATTNSAPVQPVAATHIPSASQIVWNWNAVEGATGYKWSTTNNFSTAADLGNVTTKTQTGLNCNAPYTSYVWAYNSCGNSTSTTMTQSTIYDLPPAPEEGTHVATYTEIVWNWNPVSGATGYKWNTVDDYNSAIYMATATSKTETGLDCGTSYTRYVWAFNSCGNSISGALIQSTSDCFVCGTNLQVSHVVSGGVAPVDKTVTYGTVSNIPGETAKCWITSNLGSDHQATAKNDTTEASAGWYWQFNRKQGYKHSGLSRTPNTTWIYSISETSDWTAANDPCTLEIGNGWRVPTRMEWENVDAAGGWINTNGPWNSALKMHAAGRLVYSSGTLGSRGIVGVYWSNTMTSTSTAWKLDFGAANCEVLSWNKAYGSTIRCIKE